jgi:carbonic anhydrase
MKSPARRVTRVAMVGLGMAVAMFGRPGAAAAGSGATPETTIERLRSGNERFVRAWAATAEPVRAARRAPAEAPSVAVLSCADAAVPPEQLFDTTPGDVFSVRVAGPVTDRVVVASLEQAVERQKVTALVVMGHDVCATLRGAAGASAARPRRSDVLGDALAPALTKAASRADLDARLAPMQAAIEHTVNDLLRASELLRQHVRAGDLAVVGAYYEAETGRVVFSRRIERVPEPAAAVRGTR